MLFPLENMIYSWASFSVESLHRKLVFHAHKSILMPYKLRGERTYINENDRLYPPVCVLSGLFILAQMRIMKIEVVNWFGSWDLGDSNELRAFCFLIIFCCCCCSVVRRRERDLYWNRWHKMFLFSQFGWKPRSVQDNAMPIHISAKGLDFFFVFIHFYLTQRVEQNKI